MPFVLRIVASYLRFILGFLVLILLRISRIISAATSTTTLPTASAIQRIIVLLLLLDESFGQ